MDMAYNPESPHGMEEPAANRREGLLDNLRLPGLVNGFLGADEVGELPKLRFDYENESRIGQNVDELTEYVITIIGIGGDYANDQIRVDDLEDGNYVISVADESNQFVWRQTHIKFDRSRNRRNFPSKRGVSSDLTYQLISQRDWFYLPGNEGVWGLEVEVDGCLDVKKENLYHFAGGVQWSQEAAIPVVSFVPATEGGQNKLLVNEADVDDNGVKVLQSEFVQVGRKWELAATKLSGKKQTYLGEIEYGVNSSGDRVVLNCWVQRNFANGNKFRVESDYYVDFFWDLKDNGWWWQLMLNDRFPAREAVDEFRRVKLRLDEQNNILHALWYQNGDWIVMGKLETKQRKLIEKQYDIRGGEMFAFKLDQVAKDGSDLTLVVFDKDGKISRQLNVRKDLISRNPLA
jgi:hypothetical protein